MANEITFGWKSGSTLTYGAYQPDGSVRTAAATALPEIGTTGYYTATDAAIIAGDFVIVKESTMVVGEGQYKPEVSVSGVTADLATIEGKIDTIDTVLDTVDSNIDTLITMQNNVVNIIDESQVTPSLQVMVE